MAALSSSLEFKKAYVETLDTADVAYQPELRWIVDPNDFLRPMVYDPDDARWSSPGDGARVHEFCDRDDDDDHHHHRHRR